MSAPAPRDAATAAVVAHEMALEQAHVDAVYRQLGSAHRLAEVAQEQGNAMYQIDRSDFLREENSTAMFERDAFTFQAAKRLKVLEDEAEGLVFGRLDGAADDIRYIGRIGVRDDDYEPLVIDWRAPAAEPFYRATMANPMGMRRRRVLRCKGTAVMGIEDDPLCDDGDLPIIGEGALMSALNRARGHQMRDIVATIQAEQDEAIRAPYQGVTIISGGPGTGKTVVALHRAAYLLYSNRRRFEHGGVLVIGPSALFMNYIERVLPSLGEDSVTLRPIGAVAHDVIRVKTERIDEPDAAAIKGSLAMVSVMKKLVGMPLVEPAEDLRVSVKGDIYKLSPAQLKRIRHDVLSGHALNRSRALAEQAMLEAFWTQLPDDVDIERDQFDSIVADQTAFQTFLSTWWPALRPELVLPRLADLELATTVAKKVLTPAQIETLSASYRNHDPELPAWSVADVALLDEIFALLGPLQADTDPDSYDPTQFLEDGAGITELVSTTDRVYTRHVEVDPDDEGHATFAHVLVDEAQDITPMQWRMLRRRGPQASWTIVGDPAQSSWPDAAETRTALNELIGSSASRTFRMSTNYRSPAEVFDLAGRMISAHVLDADLPTAVRTTGVAPELTATTPTQWLTTLSASVHQALADVDGTIGIIAVPERQQACTDMLQAQLSPADFDRLAIVTPLACKGLEYDAAIVVDPDQIVAQTSGGFRVLYVALTRPTQRLIVIDINESAAPGAWRP
ncbi:MAG: HelD family protein [Propionibacteriaceae bacterium]